MTTDHIQPLPVPSPSHVLAALDAPLPTRKERLIHRRVCIEGRFAEDVAREQSQSPERVQLTATSVQQWLMPVQTDVDSHQIGALHLERLEHQWREAMAAWYRSGQQAEVVKVSFEEGKKNSEGEPPASAEPKATKTKAKPDGKQKIERTMRGGCGDVRYLEQARRIMAEYRELCGMVEKLTQAQRETHVAELSDQQRDQQAAGGVAVLRERKDACQNSIAADESAADADA